MSASKPSDELMMERAMRNAEKARLLSSPNPWVGSVLVAPDGEVFDGWTMPVGAGHAEVNCLLEAGSHSRGSTLYTTLEPCSHTGNTPPCSEALIKAGVERVVIGIVDPDEKVNGQGIAHLKASGVEVEVGVKEAEVRSQLLPYIHHRKTGRPYVVVKIAMTLDGRIAAPDGSSQWITGPAAREAGHKLRAYSDAVCVGAETVRLDNPRLTVRDWTHEAGPDINLDPERIVLGQAPDNALVHPCIELSGEIEDVLEELGKRGILQLLVEGGGKTISRFHDSGCVDRYEIFFAAAFFGGDDAVPMLSGEGSLSMKDLWRGEIVELSQLGNDFHVTVRPKLSK
ncbi:MAG: riboflavin biosynthesis protein RibD [Acidimicrobiaceae bacterium]|nr:riboflavin biosynthesis protein RibD [Acidimicrobiaceae bacterium]